MLLAYAERFIGLGDPSSRYWFLWTGPMFPVTPAGADYCRGGKAESWYQSERQRLLTAIERWSQDASEVCRFEDIYGYTSRSGYPHRAAVARIAEALRTRSVPYRHPVTKEASDNVFRAELFPLSAPGLTHFGSPGIFAAFMHSRRAYMAYRRIQRLQRLRDAIAQFSPEVVFMFGRMSENVWLEMPDPHAHVSWAHHGPIQWATVGCRLYIASPSPTAMFITPERFEAILEAVVSIAG